MDVFETIEAPVSSLNNARISFGKTKNMVIQVFPATEWDLQK